MIRAAWALTSRRDKLLAGTCLALAAGAIIAFVVARHPAPPLPAAEPGMIGAAAPLPPVQQPIAATPPPAITEMAPPPPPPVAAATPPPEPFPDLARLVRAGDAPIENPTTSAPQPAFNAAEVVGQVTALAALLREALEQQGRLRERVVKVEADHRAALADLNQRLAFAEARNAVAAAVGASETRAVPGQAPRPVPAPRRGAAPSYEITAASPGLALLKVTNPSPGQQERIEVAIGTEVPGYGKVIRIAQKGTAWEVVTDKGVIGQ